MKRLYFLVFALFIYSCSVDRTITVITENEEKLVSTFHMLERQSKLSIADEAEPGERLILCLTFVDKENEKPLSSQEVQFYHATSQGEYEPDAPNDESTARLKGICTTDSLGRLYIETILPGDYGRSDDNRHIHATVSGAKPEAYDIHFRQFITPMGRNFINRSDQHFLADLKYLSDSTLISFLQIEVKNPLTN